MFPEGSYNTKTDTDINLDAFSLILFHSILNYTLKWWKLNEFHLRDKTTLSNLCIRTDLLKYFTLKNPLNTPIQKETTRSHDKLCRVLRATTLTHLASINTRRLNSDYIYLICIFHPPLGHINYKQFLMDRCYLKTKEWSKIQQKLEINLGVFFNV